MSDRVVRTFITVVALLVPAQAALAGFGATESYLLSVGEGPGAAGSHWYTTVWISNPTDQDAQLTVEFLGRGTSNPSPPVYTGVVPPGETLYLEDALETMFALNNRFGAFRFVSDRTIIVTSRIYSRPSGGAVGDSVGQLFTAVPAEFAIAAGESTELLGVSQASPVEASELRYNFGLVETGGGNVTVRVSAYEGYDPTVALATKEYTLGPYGVMQQNISDLLPSPQAVGVRLTLEVLSGSTGKVAAFGSGLANRSNDPSTFEMSFDESLLGNGTGNGGLQQVHHDATLAGEGTSASPLGVAASGVGNVQLADDAVGSGKIIDGTVGPDDLADGAVRKSNIAASGGTAGDVLAWDGSALQWQAPAGGGLTLPYDGTGSSDYSVFTVTNTSTNSQSSAITGVAKAGSGVSAYTNVGYGLQGWSNDGIGIVGAIRQMYVRSGIGVYGDGGPSGATGVRGHSDAGDGVWGSSWDPTKSGVYGTNADSNGWAGYFQGKVEVTGNLTKGGGAFKIDHPLDPENRYLYHSFVESPDMMNVYNGNVVLGEDGAAWVELPEWFEALNRDFRYQLTCIGGFAPVYVAEEIAGNQFQIAGGEPGLKVSWQVTGIRHDAWAEANRIPVEEPKTGVEQGTYIHPRAYGMSEDLSTAWAHRPEKLAEEQRIRNNPQEMQR